MNILHLVNSFGFSDGCARHVSILAREQARAGHVVHVMHGGGDGDRMLKESGTASIIEPLIDHRQRSLTRFLRGVSAMRRYLRDVHPDIVHAHHFYACNQAILARAGRRNALVQTVHANIPPAGSLPQFPAGRVIAVSEATRRMIMETGRRGTRVVEVVHCAVDFPGNADEVRTTRAWQRLQARRPDRFVVAFFGRFVEVKGVAVLLSALASMGKDIPVTLVMAGSGELESALLHEANALGIDMEFFGQVRDVMPLLELTDVVAVPSLRMEGLPIVVLEAGLMRVPVIASRTDGIPEVVADGVSGLLVPPGDPVAVAHALRLLHADPPLRASMGEALFGTIQRVFNIPTMMDRIERIYQKSLLD
jgi:glycosyltransferase involved in cell wall biosynthesis